MATMKQGSDKSLLFRVRLPNGDADDIALYETIKVESKANDDTIFTKSRLARTGDTTNASDVIANVSDLEHIVEGQPISGAGIPANTTVLKTPSSEESPSAAGTIKISAPATATATGVALVIGNISPVSPSTLGKFLVNYDEDDTLAHKPGVNALEVTLVKSGDTKIKTFQTDLTVEAKVYTR